MRKHTFICALVAVAFLATAQERKAQPNQPTAQREKQNTNAQPVSTPINNSSPQINDSAEAERKREQQQSDAKEDALKAEQLRQGRIIVWATVVMAVSAGINLIIAGVYAYFALRTLWAVEKQSTHASEQVDVMERQLAASKHALYVSERPYIQVFDVTANLPFALNKPVKYGVKVENKGKTPAYDLEGAVYFSVRYANDPLPDSPEYVALPTLKSRITLGSGLKTRRDGVIDLKLPQKGIDMIKEGKILIYIYGFELYRDGFNTETRRTNYCHIYHAGEGRFILNSSHNDSD